MRNYYRILLSVPLSRASLPLLAGLLGWGAWQAISLELGKPGVRTAGLEVAGAIWLVGIMFQFIRRFVRRRRPDWGDVSATQRAYRLLMAGLFLVLVSAPFVWFAMRLH